MKKNDGQHSRVIMQTNTGYSREGCSNKDDSQLHGGEEERVEIV